jgi:hypothetical protein
MLKKRQDTIRKQKCLLACAYGEEKTIPFGSVDRAEGRTSTFSSSSLERFTSVRSDFPCRLATVRSSGMRMFSSESNSAYSFACSLRRRQTISSASCMYIIAQLFNKSSYYDRSGKDKWGDGIHRDGGVKLCCVSGILNSDAKVNLGP